MLVTSCSCARAGDVMLECWSFQQLPLDSCLSCFACLWRRRVMLVWEPNWSLVSRRNYSSTRDNQWRRPLTLSAKTCFFFVCLFSSCRCYFALKTCEFVILAERWLFSSRARVNKRELINGGGGQCERRLIYRFSLSLCPAAPYDEYCAAIGFVDAKTFWYVCIRVAITNAM